METTEHIYIAEEAPRGKHTRCRGKRRRPSRVSRVNRIAAAGFAVASVAGACAYFAVSTVQHENDAPTIAAEVGAPDRATDDRASRSGSGCARTGPGQARVEMYLQNQTARFGAIDADSEQDPGDCATIKRFQAYVGLPAVTGYADEATAAVAERLTNSDPAACDAAPTTTVCVDLTHQTIWVMRAGGTVLAPTVMRSGRKGLVTPSGRYTIDQKKTYTVSSEYHTPLPYWERFFQDYGIHAASTSLYTDNDPGSHGCVTLISRDAKALFAITEIGTDVHIFGTRPGT